LNANKQWGLRLKQARLAKGWSQKNLGMRAGLDEFVASTRINRYELGVHKADLLIAKNLAKVLGISVAFLYATDDDVAALLFRYGKAKKAERAQIQKLLEHIPMPPTPSD
jgi:transcriptional regulator with XRE-family HTH domain